MCKCEVVAIRGGHQIRSLLALYQPFLASTWYPYLCCAHTYIRHASALVVEPCAFLCPIIHYFIFLSFCFRFVLRCRWRCVNVRRNFSYPTDDLPDWHSCILLIGQCEEHMHIQRTMQESTSPTQSSRRKTSLGAHSPLHTPSFLLLCLHVVRWIRRAHPH